MAFFLNTNEGNLFGRKKKNLIAMLRWIIYIKSFNLKVQDVVGKDNVMAKRLPRDRYKGEGKTFWIMKMIWNF